MPKTGRPDYLAIFLNGRTTCQFYITGFAALIADQSCVMQDVPPFFCARDNRAIPEGFNVLAHNYLSAHYHLQRVMLSVYEQLYHQAVTIDKVKSVVQRLSVEYPQLRCFNDFFRLSMRGIIR